MTRAQVSHSQAVRETTVVAFRSGVVPVATPERPLVLESGKELRHAGIAYEDLGPIDADRIVLVCHALTGDAHVARPNHDDDDASPGWWETLVGPGGAIDTRTTRVICSNVLGGCAGSTGPTSIDPTTGVRFGPEFPTVTIGDMVTAQRRLLDDLGISGPVHVIGGSIGGFQVLEWIRMAPDRLASATVIGSGTALNAFGLAHNAIARNVIRADPRFLDGRYDADRPPSQGLAAARQLAHLTYRSAVSFERRFGRRLENDRLAVHGYLDHQGSSFVRRFDANTYLGLLDAMDAYDATRDDRLAEGFRRLPGPLLVAGFTSDLLFPPAQSREIVAHATHCGARATMQILDTDDGHDAFLLPNASLARCISSLLADGAER